MAVKNRENASIQEIWDVQRALGGEKRGWHPYFRMNDREESEFEMLDERPGSVEDWGRPELEDETKNIGDAIEEYLAERYWMEEVDDGAVDVVVTEGPFSGVPVQAKGAAVLVTQGEGRDGRMYSRPGGFYMREDRMEELADEEEAILYTAVHHPQWEFEEEPDAPVIEINEEVDSAVIGELAFPAADVYEATDFDSDGKKYWNWDKAYGERPDTRKTVERWYDDTFLQARTG